MGLHPPAHRALRAHLERRPSIAPGGTIVRACHERWDGEGYPDRLRGNEIQLAARIVAVCDAYDTIISNRCYRAARSPRQACEELRREAGHQFDPVVVATFLEELDRPGSERSGAAVPGAQAQPDGHAKLAADVASKVRELLASTEVAIQDERPPDRSARPRAVARTRPARR